MVVRSAIMNPTAVPMDHRGRTTKPACIDSAKWDELQAEVRIRSSHALQVLNPSDGFGGKKSNSLQPKLNCPLSISLGVATPGANGKPTF